MPDNSLAGTAETMDTMLGDDATIIRLDTCRECDHPSCRRNRRILATYHALAETRVYLKNVGAELTRCGVALAKEQADNTALRASLAEAERYGRSADNVIADLRDQLAAYSLFPVDAARPHATPEGK